jgi:rhodanese-related sulfurtransferase
MITTTCTARCASHRPATARRPGSPAGAPRRGLTHPARSTTTPRPAVTAARATSTRGASGMDINGARPTSPRAWEEIQATLKGAGVGMVTPQEVSFLASRPSSLILDCRPPAEFAAGHIPGAVSIPLYRPITGLSARAVARRAVFAFFGVLNGTEANPDFWADAAAAMAGVREVVVYCNMGGTMTPTQTNKAGAQSRSLSAAYELVKVVSENANGNGGGGGGGGGSGTSPAGGLGGLLMAAAAAATGGGSFKPKISVLKGGFYEWRKAGRPVEVGDEAGGRAEAAAAVE